MASPSEVKAGLDAISRTIEQERAKLKAAKAAVAASVATLQAIPTAYAGVIATINDYDPATTELAEQVAVSEKSVLTAEFVQLLGKGQAAKTALNGMAFDHE